MIGRMATNQFRVVRRTTTLLEPRLVAASIPTLQKCPVHPGLVEIRLVGAGGLTGTVTVVGDVDGVPDTEVVTFSGPIANDTALERTCKRFDCVRELQTSGLADESPLATIQAKFTGSGGDPIHTNCILSDCVMGHLEHGGQRGWPVPVSGAVERAPNATIDHDPIFGFDPRRGDLYIEQRDGADFRIWEVREDPLLLGYGHHWELNVQIRNGIDVAEVPA